jgi:hypothetical protein
MNNMYDKAIEPAVRDAGYRPIGVDRTEHVNRIDDEIIGRIKAGRFMVADFTGHRQGVYFEAGMMLGLARTVIWMCKDEELAASHFDTRQYNFINCKSAEEAQKRVRPNHGNRSCGAGKERCMTKAKEGFTDLMKTTTRWLLFEYKGLELVILSKAFKTKKLAEKARQKYPDRMRRKIGIGLIKT